MMNLLFLLYSSITEKKHHIYKMFQVKCQESMVQLIFIHLG